MISANRKIAIVGAFPPPLHGMSTINFRMHQFLEFRGYRPIVFNLSSNKLGRDWYLRVLRSFYVFKCLIKFSYFLLKNKHISVYLGISGGRGQIYEILFILLAKMRGCNLFLHHHSFLYLDTFTRPPTISRILFKVAGPEALHISLCEIMAIRIKEIYPAANKVMVLSNAVFVDPPLAITKGPPKHEGKVILGFLGNIEEDKGINQFLDVLLALQKEGFSYEAVIAGPFMSNKSERSFNKRVNEIKNIKYCGPIYGDSKAQFWKSIDILLYPTKNDAEPLTVIEGLSYGVPVLTTAKGCLPNMVDKDSGMVIRQDHQYIEIVMNKLNIYRENPEDFSRASTGAIARYNSLRRSSEVALENLFKKIS